MRRILVFGPELVHIEWYSFIEICDQWDDFNFEIMINILFLGGDVHRFLSYGIYFAAYSFYKSCSNVDDFINSNPI